jgi:hypothetical protein
LVQSQVNENIRFGSKFPEKTWRANGGQMETEGKVNISASQHHPNCGFGRIFCGGRPENAAKNRAIHSNSSAPPQDACGISASIPCAVPYPGQVPSREKFHIFISAGILTVLNFTRSLHGMFPKWVYKFLAFVFFLCLTGFSLKAQEHDPVLVDPNIAAADSRVLLAISTADYPATPGDVYALSFRPTMAGNAVVTQLVLDARSQLKVLNMGSINARGKPTFR